jgi:hypothetical protein
MRQALRRVQHKLVIIFGCLAEHLEFRCSLAQVGIDGMEKINSSHNSSLAS